MLQIKQLSPSRQLMVLFSGYWSEWSITLMLLVVCQLSRDVIGYWLTLTLTLCCTQTDNHFTATAYLCQGQRQTGGQTGSSIQDQMLRLPGFLHW